MTFTSKIYKFLLYAISEIEANLSTPGSPLSFRKKYLTKCHVKYGSKLWVGRLLLLINGNGLTLGEGCALGECVRIAVHAPITIGNNFLGATGLAIDSGGHDIESLEPYAKAITIGNNVWTGINVTILAGVHIGDNVVIGAGSVVTSDIPSNSVAVGVPAKVIKKIQRPNTKIWSWVNAY